MTSVVHREIDRRTAPDAVQAPYAQASELRRLRSVFGRQSRITPVVKRAVDLVFAATLLVILNPIFLLIGLTLLLHLRRNPLFLHERVGEGGTVFKCLKFRTMRTPQPAEELALHSAFKAGTDTCTTAVTRWLRRSSLDELPQLVNVLLGQMSLVGPRPIVVQELHVYFGALAPVLLMVKPGMTGLWTVNGRSNVNYPERILMELKYATTSSLWLDLRVLLKTLIVVLSRDGAL